MKNITYKGQQYNIPFEIVCTLSGQVKVYSSEEFINGKIDRFGTLENLRATYVCRDAQRLQKQGKSKEEIIEMLKNGVEIPRTTPQPKSDAPSSEAPEAPKVKLDPVKPLVSTPVTKENAGASCHNPGWLLDGKPCTNCAFKSICNYEASPRGKLKALVGRK